MCRSIGVREHGLVAAGWTAEVALVAERGGRGVVAEVCFEGKKGKGRRDAGDGIGESEAEE